MKYYMLSIVLIGLGILAVSMRRAETKEGVKLIPRTVLFGNPVKALPKISPDGTQLAYLAPVNNVLNIWVKTLGKDDDRPVTSDTNRGVRKYFWAPDGTQLLYLQDTDGNENWRLYGTNIATKETRCYTDFENVAVRVEVVDKYHKDTILISMNKENPKLYDLYELTLSTGELKLLEKNSPELNAIDYLIDRNFIVRGAYISKENGDRQVVLKEQDGNWKPIITWSAEDIVTSMPIGFNYDSTVLYLRDSRDSDTTRCVKFDLKTKECSVVAQDPKYDLGTTYIDDDTCEILAVCFAKEREEWVILDKEFEKLFNRMASLDTGEMRIVSVDHAKNKHVISFNKDNGSLVYYLYDKNTDTGSFLFEANPALKQYELASMKPIQYKTRDGLTIEGYLTLPVGIEPKNLPLVLNVHGGPQIRDKWGYDPEAQWLANRGYAVLQVNYRGSSGYGKKFLNAGNKEWGAKMHNDLLDAVNWAVDHGIADPKKVAIYGGSYGGYAALFGATFTPDVFCCAVDVVGPSDLITLVKSIPPYWSSYIQEIYKRIGNPETEAEFLKSRSPYYKIVEEGATKISPLLIGQGGQDPRVIQEHSEKIVAALKERNIPCEYILFPDEGHGFAKPENRLKFFAAAEKFLAQHLGGRYES